MRQDYTHISILLDRSGSMESIKEDTIGGFNQFLNSQKEVEGKCTVSFTQFNTKHESLALLKDIRSIENLCQNVILLQVGELLYMTA